MSGSHRRTLRNLRRLIEAGVSTRAAVIAIDDDADNLSATRAYLADLGTDVGTDRLTAPREFGRGQELLGKTASMSGLCGNCWRGSLAIAPDGAVYTCVMAREWPVGDITEQTLAAVVRGPELARTRREVYESTFLAENACSPYCYQCCTPDWQCPCDPIVCQQSCTPYGNPPVTKPK